MDDSALSELKRLREQAQAARRPFEDEWLLSIARYQGDQWHYAQGGRLYKPQLAAHRVQFVDNRVIGILRTEIAKMTSEQPVFTVTPRTADDDDMEAALIGERILDYLWAELKLTRRLRSALLWARICSAGFWKCYWDSKKGQSMEALVGPDGEPLTDGQGQIVRTDRPDIDTIMQALPPQFAGQLQKKTVYQGDACVEVRSPFEILPDPLAEEGGLEEAEWLIEESVRSQDYVRKRYGVELEPDADAVAGIAESRMGQTAVGGSGSYKGVQIFELWERPSSKHAKGRRVVWAADKVLAEDDNPYPGLPYVMFGGVPVPGRFWPTSTAEQIGPVNVELNKTRSQIRENAARFGNPSLLRNRQSNVEFSGLPGEEVLFDGTMADSVPSYLQPPEMPQYVQAELDRAEQSLNEISGQHEVTRGQVPSGVTAASAINLLQEQDDTRLANDVADMEGAIAEAGTMLLRLVAEGYTDERTIRIAGEDGAWDIFEFRGNQLRDNTQVEVKTGAGGVRSKAAKQAAMQEVLTLALQYGLPLKPRDLRRFLKGYEVGGLERLFADLSHDEGQINRENRQLSRGQQLGINSFDDDELHIEGHEEFQKTARYARLPDEVRGVIEDHVAQHRMRYLEAQQAMAEAANPPQGDDPLTAGKRSAAAAGNSSDSIASSS